MSRTLGRYQIIAELGRGGMGIVSLAVAKGMGRFNKLIVVKELMPELTDDPGFVGMFLDEARLAARLNHPNIVQSHELGADGQRHFMAMDYLEGRTLARILRRLKRNNKTKLSLGVHMRVLCEVLAGLHYAHELTDFDGQHLEIVHRDVSPHNIFVTFDGQVKLMDFGVAKNIDAAEKTAPGVLKGKIGYMAPEQSRGEKIDRRSDIFTVGILTWEAMVGRRMWEGLTDIEVLGRIMRGQVPTPESVEPNVPPGLSAICARAMSIQPDQRYATAHEMLVEIEAWLDSSRLKTSLRELGALVAEVFADERAHLKELIEGYLTKLDSGGSMVDLAKMEERVGTIASGRTPTQRASGLPDLAPVLTDPPPSRTPAATAAALGPPSVTAPPSLSLPAAPPFRRVWPIVGIAVGATTVVAVIVSVALRGPSAAAPTGAVSADMVAPAPTHDKVELTVRVTPADAAIFIDDRPVGNPFRGTFPKDSAQHEIRTAARGYDAKIQSVVFDGNVTVDVSLRPAEAPPAPPSRASGLTGGPPSRPIPSRAAPPRASAPPPADAPFAPSPSPSPELSPSGGKIPLRTIEPSSPYGNP